MLGMGACSSTALIWSSFICSISLQGSWAYNLVAQAELLVWRGACSRLLLLLLFAFLECLLRLLFSIGLHSRQSRLSLTDNPGWRPSAREAKCPPAVPLPGRGKFLVHTLPVAAPNSQEEPHATSIECSAHL